MENCLASVRFWITVNKHKLNDAKTEVMVAAGFQKQCLLRDVGIKIGEAIVKPKLNVKKTLGAVLDATLSMEKQVSSFARRDVLQHPENLEGETLSHSRSLCKCHQCNSHIPSWLLQWPPAWHNQSTDLPVTSSSKQRCTLPNKNTIQTIYHASTSTATLAVWKTTYYVQSADNHPQVNTFLYSSSILERLPSTLVVKRLFDKYSARTINILGAQL